VPLLSHPKHHQIYNENQKKSKEVMMSTERLGPKRKRKKRKRKVVGVSFSPFHRRLCPLLASIPTTPWFPAAAIPSTTPTAAKLL
jgi:hypothetical protein